MRRRAASPRAPPGPVRRGRRLGRPDGPQGQRLLVAGRVAPRYARGDDGERVPEGRGRRRPVGVRRALPQRQRPDRGAVHGVVRGREEVPQEDPHHERAERAHRGGNGRGRVRLPPWLQDQHRRHVQGRLEEARAQHRNWRGPSHLVRRMK